MALLWVSIPLSECTIRASLFFHLIKSGKPLKSESLWLACANDIGTTVAAAAAPAKVTEPVKKFLLNLVENLSYLGVKSREV